jgi:hypothetical protein
LSVANLLPQLPRFLPTKRLGAKSSSSRFSIVIAAVGIASVATAGVMVGFIGGV